MDERWDTPEKDTEKLNDKYLIFVNPENQKEKRIKVGFAWDFFLLGHLGFLLRGFVTQFFIFAAFFIGLDMILLYFGIEVPISAYAATIGMLFGMWQSLSDLCFA